MKILLVSIAFPPKRDPESLQVAKYCKYLKNEQGLTIDIVTSKNPTLFMDVDETLKPYCEGLNIVSELQIFENRYLNFLIRKFNSSLLRYPDSKFTFWWQAKKILRSAKKPDVIYSRSYPVSSTLLALQLKKKWERPWILHLSDPWAIGSENSLSPATYLTGKPRKWNRRKELECFELADRICLTSQKTIELYEEEYPQFKGKFVYMPNVFDDENLLPNPWQKGDKLSFVYTGGFGEARSPETLLKAIEIFWNNAPENVINKVQFVFTGEMTKRNQSIFRKFEYIPIIRHLGVIPYSQVVSLQRTADILINIDSDINDSKQTVFFPSKLLEYISAQRRILAITNINSTTYQIVQGKIGDCFEFSFVNVIADYFAQCFKKYCDDESSFFCNSRLHYEFSAKKNVERLISLFKDVMHDD